MALPLKPRDIAGRLSTGAFVLHSGVEKLSTPDDHAAVVHGMAVGAFPVLKNIPAPRFVRMLAIGEIVTGAALLLPVVPTALAGAALTGFSGALMAMYARTPALRKAGSIWPTPQGIGVSKDVWMLGIGLGFLTDALVARRAARR